MFKVSRYLTYCSPRIDKEFTLEINQCIDISQNSSTSIFMICSHNQINIDIFISDTNNQLFSCLHIQKKNTCRLEIQIYNLQINLFQRVCTEQFGTSKSHGLDIIFGSDLKNSCRYCKKMLRQGVFIYTLFSIRF